MSAAELNFEIQQFYARQMRCLDGGDAAGFASTFTADAVFTHEPGEVITGRPVIAATTNANITRIRDAKVTRRHWFGMMVIEPESEDLIRTQYLAMTTSSNPDGGATVGAVSLVDDVLVRHDGQLSTASRTVRGDRVTR